MFENKLQRISYRKPLIAFNKSSGLVNDLEVGDRGSLDITFEVIKTSTEMINGADRINQTIKVLSTKTIDKRLR